MEDDTVSSQSTLEEDIASLEKLVITITLKGSIEKGLNPEIIHLLSVELKKTKGGSFGPLKDWSALQRLGVEGLESRPKTSENEPGIFYRYGENAPFRAYKPSYR